MSQPWDRISHPEGGSSSESRKAYAAFLAYRDLGPERSLEKAVLAYTGSKGRLAKWKAWSVKWNWVGRTDQWDAHQEQLNRDAEEKAMADYYETLAIKKLAYQDTVFDIVDRLIAQVLTMLNWPLSEQTIRNEAGVTIIKPARWSKSDIPRFAEVADKMFRLAAGLETERYAVRMEDEVRKAVKEMAEERGLNYEDVMAEIEILHHAK